jgi:flagellar hook protein FlgE
MSMYIGVSGLKAATVDLNTTSQNIANASTTGFKNSRAEFGDLVDSNASKNAGIGVQTQAVNQIFQQGAVITTGNALDLAIVGNGFFQVQEGDAGQVSYTRAGSFHVDNEGYIVNNLGQRLQDGSTDAGGTPLQFTGKLPVDSITFNKTTGEFSAKDADGADVTIGPLNLTNFESMQGLKKISDTQWLQTPEAGDFSFGLPGSGNLGNLMSGALEASNVDLTDQLVNMIVAQRNFQANSKTITTNQYAHRDRHQHDPLGSRQSELMDRMLYVAMTGAQQTLRSASAHQPQPGQRQHRRLSARIWPTFAACRLSAMILLCPARVYSMAERPGIDLTQGKLMTTGRDLDIAIQGEGWIAIQAPRRQRSLHPQPANCNWTPTAS